MGYYYSAFAIHCAVGLAYMKPFKVKVLLTYAFYVTIVLMRNIRA